MTIGKTLRRLRQEKGLSQLELAARSNVSQQLISQIERDVNTSTRAIPSLALAMGVHISELDPRFLEATGRRAEMTEIPLISAQEVVRGGYRSEQGDYVTMVGLEVGDWIATTIDDDVIDRVAPPGATVIINRADKDLVDGGVYLFAEDGAPVFRRYRKGRPAKLLPFSLNPEHFSMPYERQRHAVVGRVRRTIIEL